MQSEHMWRLLAARSNFCGQTSMGHPVRKTRAAFEYSRIVDPRQHSRRNRATYFKLFTGITSVKNLSTMVHRQLSKVGFCMDMKACFHVWAKFLFGMCGTPCLMSRISNRRIQTQVFKLEDQGGYSSWPKYQRSEVRTSHSLSLCVLQIHG